MSDGVLVLGAAGFIGRHVVAALSASDTRPVAAIRSPLRDLPPGVESSVAEFIAPEHFKPLLERCRTVIHAASTSTPSSSGASPLTELDSNLRTTLALLAALQEFPDRRLIYLSSGGALYGNRTESPVDETTPLRPRSYHGAGKAAAEQFIHAWAAQCGGGAVILRPSNVYGPGQLPKSGFGIIPTAFEHALRGTPLAIWGDGSAIRDYLYIDDLTALVTRILESGIGEGVTVFNASRGQGTSLNSLLDAIERVTGEPLERVYQAGRSVDVNSIVPDPGSLAMVYQWEATTGIEDGLERTWRWHTAHR